MRKPKISNVLPSRKNFVKSVRKQYENPDSHPFFFVKNTNFDFKCTQIYQYSIFLSSDTYFSRLFHYKQENIFITGRITAIVLPAAEHLKLGPHHFPEPSFHRIVVLPNCNLVESLFCGKKISESLSERNV